jgi:mannose/fructose/N-acetylgalactosamine-specific phosphotransferase system component IID
MRLEADGMSESAARLESGLSRALGGLGDALIWSSLRPGLVLLAIVASAWWGAVAALAVWLLFAVLQGWLRSRCLNIGYERGGRLSELVAHPAAHALGAGMRRAGALLAGLAMTLVLVHLRRAEPDAAPAVMLGSVVAGSMLLSRRMSPELLSASALVVWVLVRLLNWVGGA